MEAQCSVRYELYLLCVCVCVRVHIYIQGIKTTGYCKISKFAYQIVRDTECVYFVHLLPFPTITRGLFAVIISLAASLTSAGSGHASGGSGQMEVCTTVLLATR
jgi:hypothetical protein